MARHPSLVASLAIAIAISALSTLFPASTWAADGLIVTSDSVYQVLPDEGRVLVTINAVATNVTPDTATEQYFFTGLTMPIQAGAAQIAASAGGAALPVGIVEQTEEYIAVEVTFGTEVFFQESYGLQVTYVLEDAGGAPERETIIRKSFVGFPVWAFATPDATTASVEVSWPKGYALSIPLGSMRETVGENGPLLSARDIEDPTAFFAYVTGESDGARTREEVAVPMRGGDADLLMLAWIDDPDWLERQTAFLVDGLPALERAIGVDYPVSGTLSVSEHAFRHLGDYAGVFNPTAATIQMRFDADAFTALHEAAHAWFNGGLFGDRWILEAFASHYAEQVGTELELEMQLPELTEEIAEAAFPLNDWLDPTFDDLAREDYAYAATRQVAAEIAELAGADGLQAVWVAADADRLAYAAADDDARDDADPQPESWQRLLDLLENETAADYDPIYAEWILNAGQVALLADRDAARAIHDATLTAADGWTLPRSTRVLMDAWDFAAAEAELESTVELLEQRTTIEERAVSLGLAVTSQLQTAFEDDGLDAARREVGEQLDALDRIDEATMTLDPDWQIAEQIGLLGQTSPRAALDAAREAFEAADDAEAEASAVAAVEQRSEADSRGRTRVAVAGGILLGIDALAMALFALFLRRRRNAPRPTV